MSRPFDVIVIGGGHAACEAAHASARLGCSTAMLVPKLETIARMSCNPAIGGPGKSQIVREVDSLGGLMATVTDRTGLQYRILNAGKGPAVRANRAQADTAEYEAEMRKTLEGVENLVILEAVAETILAEGESVGGVLLAGGGELPAKAVVVSTGTFLNGLMHVGPEQMPGGRIGEPPATKLSDSLRKLGFTLGRLKTGTPPRLERSSIDFGRMEIQPGDAPPMPFSYSTDEIRREQLPCHITHTTARTHEVIRNAFDRSPLFSGVIKGVGPRYCPSIEDKVARFPERTSHHIFLEPVSRTSSNIYPNGISTSLPADVQEEFVRTIPGLEDARINVYGYAVEYDFAPPTQLYSTLETKKIAGLYFAGQINGTSGYEEAAGQGILAGINAALKVQGREQITLSRSESYIGVLVDDLTTLGTEEPYRMFTSRAEHRLLMRQDNADTRLCPVGHRIGLLPEEKYRMFREREERINGLVKRFKGTTLIPDAATLGALEEAGLPPLAEAAPIARYIRRPEVRVKGCSAFGDLSPFSPEEVERAETEIKYEGYIERERKWIRELEEIGNIPLGKNMDYTSIPGLSAELGQKLAGVMPMTFGQAARIPGITPAALSILMIHLKTRSRSGGK